MGQRTDDPRAQSAAADARPVHLRVGDPHPVSRQITLVDYDPAWPAQFEREAARIRRALGEAALMVEHIGSTAIPGLIAKPILDILLVVANSADEDSYVPALEGAGYILHLREPEWHEHRLFKGRKVALNMHVFSQGSPEIERVLLFRDWLRRSQADRELYAQTKRQLASQRWNKTQEYADAKSEVVEAILARASGAGGGC